MIDRLIPNNFVCQHRAVEFRKVPGRRLALMLCRSCGHQEQMSMDAALKRILSSDVPPNSEVQSRKVRRYNA